MRLSLLLTFCWGFLFITELITVINGGNVYNFTGLTALFCLFFINITDYIKARMKH